MSVLNPDERIAKKYLLSLDQGDVVFEPDGNIPPDFRLGASIGVEVRRLNQHYFEEETAQGLEQFDIFVHKCLQEVFPSFDHQYNGESYWVRVEFQRPFQGRTRKFVGDMKRALDNFLSDPRHVPCSLIVNDNVEFEISQSRPVENCVFRHAISGDEDGGGAVIQGYIDNISHCIADKKKKIEPYGERYDEWWLILVDNMGLRLTAEGMNEVRSGLELPDSLSKVFIINRSGDDCLLEIG